MKPRDTTADSFKKVVRRLLRRPTAAMAFLVMGVFVAMAVAPSWFTGSSPTQQDLRNRFAEPSISQVGDARNVLGTDHLGRDVLARITYGARTSLTVAFASFVGAGLIGLVLGLLAGFFGGWIDDVIAFAMNVQLGFPFLLVAMVLLVFVTPGLMSIVLVLIVTTWVLYARVVRGVVFAVREFQYVEAASAAGASPLRLMARHILPNILTPFLVIGSLEMARVVIIEASLSFLGLGVPPPTPTWGGMLSEGRQYMYTAPWLATIPGIAITALVLSINTIGDFFRDFVDPRMGV